MERRRVELLGHRHEADAVPVEDLDDSREVEQGPTEPVHLVNHDAVHGPRLDRCQEPLQCRAIHIAAGVAAVVEMVGDHLPALVFLAGDERLGRFPLGIEGVELLLESLLRGFARVDRAPDGLSLRPIRSDALRGASCEALFLAIGIFLRGRQG